MYNGTTETVVRTDTISLSNPEKTVKMFLDNRPSGLDVLRNPLRIYDLQMWKNDILVRDYVPVLDENSVPCLYDKVSGTLFKNIGSGNFTYGSVLKGKLCRTIYSGV